MVTKEEGRQAPREDPIEEDRLPRNCRFFLHPCLRVCNVHCPQAQPPVRHSTELSGVGLGTYTHKMSINVVDNHFKRHLLQVET